MTREEYYYPCSTCHNTECVFTGRADSHIKCKDYTLQEPIMDKIRAEIERQEKWLTIAGYNAYNVDIALDAIKSMVAESEG